ncbi:hypothetical protein BJ742DRAFT_773477 [Cladochytrium replicatum]|nr:hypothetical protein BJ742DRAFT_773477 [Cladochytrium replicatum]
MIFSAVHLLLAIALLSGIVESSIKLLNYQACNNQLEAYIRAPSLSYSSSADIAIRYADESGAWLTGNAIGADYFGSTIANDFFRVSANIGGKNVTRIAAYAVYDKETQSLTYTERDNNGGSYYQVSNGLPCATPLPAPKVTSSTGSPVFAVPSSPIGSIAVPDLYFNVTFDICTQDLVGFISLRNDDDAKWIDVRFSNQDGTFPGSNLAPVTVVSKLPQGSSQEEVWRFSIYAGSVAGVYVRKYAPFENKFSFAGTKWGSVKPAIICSNPLPKTSDLPPAWQHLGCFADPKENRSLSLLSGSVSDNGALSCIQRCVAASQFNVFAGVQSGKECWCGQSLRSANPQANTCTTSCTGDVREACGGSFAMNIFSKASSPPVPISGNVWDKFIAQEGGYATDFVNAMKKFWPEGIDMLRFAPGPFTVLIPNRDRIRAAKSEELARLLKFHVIIGPALGGFKGQGKTILATTSLNGPTVPYNILVVDAPTGPKFVSGNLYKNGVLEEVEFETRKDFWDRQTTNGTNGLTYPLLGLLVPPKGFSDSLLTVFSNEKTPYAQALQTLDLTKEFEQYGNVTIFALAVDDFDQAAKFTADGIRATVCQGLLLLQENGNKTVTCITMAINKPITDTVLTQTGVDTKGPWAFSSSEANGVLDPNPIPVAQGLLYLVVKVKEE